MEIENLKTIDGPRGKMTVDIQKMIMKVQHKIPAVECNTCIISDCRNI